MCITRSQFRPGIAYANHRAPIKLIIRDALVLHPATMIESIFVSFPKPFGATAAFCIVHTLIHSLSVNFRDNRRCNVKLVADKSVWLSVIRVPVSRVLAVLGPSPISTKTDQANFPSKRLPLTACNSRSSPRTVTVWLGNPTPRSSAHYQLGVAQPDSGRSNSLVSIRTGNRNQRHGSAKNH